MNKEFTATAEAIRAKTYHPPKTQMYVGITKDCKSLGEFYREWTDMGYESVGLGD